MHDDAEIAAAVNAGFEAAGRQEARRLRQDEGMSYEAIAKRLSVEPAWVYGAVTGKSGAQVEAWRHQHSSQGAGWD